MVANMIAKEPETMKTSRRNSPSVDLVGLRRLPLLFCGFAALVQAVIGHEPLAVDGGYTHADTKQKEIEIRR